MNGHSGEGSRDPLNQVLQAHSHIKLESEAKKVSAVIHYAFESKWNYAAFYKGRSYSCITIYHIVRYEKDAATPTSLNLKVEFNTLYRWETVEAGSTSQSFHLSTNKCLQFRRVDSRMARLWRSKIRRKFFVQKISTQLLT